VTGGPDSCPAAFDGLHPNKLGEYEIAQAFSRVLNRNYGFGSSALDVPANLSPPSCPVPTNVVATTSPYGVAVTWDHVYGARGYNIRSKRSSFGDWTETWYALTTNRYNQIWVLEGETWEYQVRTSCGDASKIELLQCCVCCGTPNCRTWTEERCRQSYSGRFQCAMGPS
jgi:hypothetical protein